MSYCTLKSPQTCACADLISSPSDSGQILRRITGNASQMNYFHVTLYTKPYVMFILWLEGDIFNFFSTRRGVAPLFQFIAFDDQLCMQSFSTCCIAHNKHVYGAVAEVAVASSLHVIKAVSYLQLNLGRACSSCEKAAVLCMRLSLSLCPDLRLNYRVRKEKKNHIKIKFNCKHLKVCL